MQEKKDLKYKIGMGFIFLGIFSPLISFAVPLLDLSTGTTTALVTFFMVGAPEIFLIAGAALAGKQAFESIKKEFFQYKGICLHLMSQIPTIDTGTVKSAPWSFDLPPRRVIQILC